MGHARYDTEPIPAARASSLAAAPSRLRWAVGATTVPARRGDLLPRTLASLRAAGFGAPRLFVDGANAVMAAGYEAEFRLPVTARDPAVLAFGNWALALQELRVREPRADRYALFQDDVLAVAGLLQYLEQCPYPERGYLNLYCHPHNERDAKGRPGWFLSGPNTRGLGAQGLVFSADAAAVLCGSETFVNKPRAARNPFRNIDGTVYDALKVQGWREWVHYPSLLQHAGDRTTIPANTHRHRSATFPGEGQFDAVSLKQG